MSMAQRILILSIAILAGLGGALAYRLAHVPDAQAGNAAGNVEAAVATPESVVGQRRPDYTVARSDGELVSASDFDGQVVLVNFWATWCAPCREEMPMLAALHDEFAGQEFSVVGIALDEVEQARSFAAELGIEYPILIGTTDVMNVVRLYGNRTGVLPYSVLVDRDGTIRWAYLGALKEDSLRTEIAKLLVDPGAA